MNYKAFNLLNVFFLVLFHLKMYICKEKSGNMNEKKIVDLLVRYKQLTFIKIL